MSEIIEKDGFVYGFVYKYDEHGNLIEEINPNGLVYKFKYDERGNRIEYTSPYNITYYYTYDEDGNCIEFITQDETIKVGY